ncbi:LOW QUALITY PROTEIN: hypothetical protein QBC45DRAFT_455738 [Copromyces sp. CBS 386.78]|nr:LOW QUALITY PROTEIN: hypothetical protein QBC45DRAFT_455738 [Copromyces sp. CBS 386.78]
MEIYKQSQDIEALEATPKDHPERANRLQSLGIGYNDRYQRTGVVADLDLSIQEALEGTPEDHLDRAHRLHSLGIGYGVMADLELAIQHLKDALEATPEDHLERASRLQSLGIGYGVVANRELAIQHLKDALEATPKDHSERSDRLQSLGRVVADLELAIQYFKEALESTPEDHPERASRLHSLGIGYRVVADLELAIQYSKEALESTLEDHPERASRLHSLGIGYIIADLELAIQHYKEVLEATPEDHPDRANRLHSLAIGYPDLELAIQHNKEALEATPEDHPERANRLHSLGVGYRVIADLELAIQYYKEATPEDHPECASRLRSLGIGYRDRYQRTGAVADLELAIQYSKEALKATPEDHPEWANRLHSLSIGYRDRYQRTGLAIQQFKKALKATPEDHPDRANRLHSLAIGYRDRYWRTGLAIQHDKEALEAIPEDHPERANRLHSLGVGYRSRYHRIGVIADLELAIQQFQEALEATPEDHPDRANRLHSLGIGYSDRYQRTRVIADLELAIQHYKEVLEATPEDHPERADRLHSLGIGYRDRYQSTGEEENLELAIQSFKEAVVHSSSAILDRLKPTTDLLQLPLKTKHWELAYEVASTAVSLIPLLTPRSLENSDKQYLLTEVSGLASDAAAVTLMVGKTPYKAMQLLELGRGVIIGSLREMRTDISNLQQKHPQLAEQYVKLRDQLNAPTSEVDHLTMPTVVPNQVNQRHDAGQKLEELIDDIRRLPGFDRFLMGPTEDELKAAAISGPIVTINVSNYRCDALIIEEHGLKSVPLPDLKRNDIEARATALVNPDAQLLEWLWDTIAKPVLDALGFTQKPDGVGPRIWWIPTGPLARFPIHAAGYHSDGSNTVLDRVISSYSSSVKALKHSTLLAERGLGKAVLIGLADLAFVSQEIKELERICGSMQLQAVMAALKDCDIFHFAGHGSTNQSDPSKSSLLLIASLFETNLQSHMPFLAYLSACGTGQVKHDKLMDEALHLIAGFRHVIGTLWEVNDASCVDAATGIYKWMQEQKMTDDSVSEGLHRASIELRKAWLLENETRAANRMAALRNKSVPMDTEQTRSNQGTTKDSRAVELYEDAPLHWVPYVHFGI